VDGGSVGQFRTAAKAPLEGLGARQEKIDIFLTNRLASVTVFQKWPANPVRAPHGRGAGVLVVNGRRLQARAAKAERLKVAQGRR
jgi:hypothetical protein